jgi:hypothetical protein
MTGARAAAALILVARLTAGPLALAGFFRPWWRGSGLLAGTGFSGYKLTGFTGSLQQLPLGTLQGGVLMVVRVLIVSVAVAALWHTLLAPVLRSHPVYVATGWYLAVLGAVTLAIVWNRSGVGVPPDGLLLWLGGAALFVACEVHQRLLPRLSTRSPGQHDALPDGRRTARSSDGGAPL